MDTRCNAGQIGATSETGPIYHPTRADVLTYYAGRALAETSLMRNDFSEAVARSYEALVPNADDRVVSISAPTAETAREFGKQIDSVRKTVERWMSGERQMPADIEEAWVQALPEPYATRCRVTLARRLGFIGAERPDAAPQRCDGSVLHAISSTSSGGMQAIVRLLEDGVIDERDAPDAPAAFAALDDLIAASRSAQERICTQTGYRPETFRLLQGVGVSA